MPSKNLFSRGKSFPLKDFSRERGGADREAISRKPQETPSWR
jgi:hypothetical protein